MARENILVVEDDTCILEFVSHSLTTDGYRVTGVESGREALRTTRAESPDLVLLDLTLPDMDGLQVCEQLKQDPRTEQVSVVMISARDKEADIVSGLDLGADDYLTKPITAKVLLARVKAVLRRAARQAFREDMRQDLVANVSHELKSPITAIKGCAQILVEGDFDDRDEADRFLNTIVKQADRANAIIEDLLVLAKAQEENEMAGATLEKARIQDVLNAAAQACELKASQRNIRVAVACQAEVEARINARLLEQAAINLIDNAIKYGDPKSEVRVAADQTGTEVVINVQDSGRGIPREHIARLFERFYRVDKARSQELGGTGLGLAIVKHIAQVHGGYTNVDSAPGRGSTFSIHLPRA